MYATAAARLFWYPSLVAVPCIPGIAAAVLTEIVVVESCLHGSYQTSWYCGQSMSGVARETLRHFSWWRHLNRPHHAQYGFLAWEVCGTQTYWVNYVELLCLVNSMKVKHELKTS